MFSLIRKAISQTETEVEAKLQESEDKNKALRTEVGELRSQLASLSVYLETHDDSDPNDLSKEFDSINELVEDLACIVADYKIWDGRVGGRQERDPELVTTVTLLLGQDMSRILSTIDHSHPKEDNIAILQYAIQGCGLLMVSDILQMFCIGCDLRAWGDIQKKIQQRGENATVDSKTGLLLT